MGRKCLKCGYERTEKDRYTPLIECPGCGAIYSKVEAIMRRGEEENKIKGRVKKRESVHVPITHRLFVVGHWVAYAVYLSLFVYALYRHGIGILFSTPRAFFYPMGGFLLVSSYVWVISFSLLRKWDPLKSVVFLLIFAIPQVLVLLSMLYFEVSTGRLLSDWGEFFATAAVVAYVAAYLKILHTLWKDG